MTCSYDECGEEIPAGAVDCPNCGYELQAEDFMADEPEYEPEENR